MIVGCYVLDLYCDGAGCKHGQHKMHPTNVQVTHDESGAGARQKARRAGWRVDLVNWKALCPQCVAAGNTYHED